MLVSIAIARIMHRERDTKRVGGDAGDGLKGGGDGGVEGGCI